MIPFSGDIRKTFIDFFKNKNHVYVPQSSVLQPNDPTIMFTNSGMVQFKDIFLGNKKILDKRLVNSQLCLRVSGKHNDLDEVGVDTYHHTLFEMLGNWSIGDFFKKEIIEWSFELLTEYYKISKERIYVTVFAGDKAEDLEADDEAYNFWEKIVPEDHIVYGDKHDNFWEMGEIGPCGPCSEIHVDLREDMSIVPGRSLVNKNHPEVIEIWNLVFMQYERLKDGKLKFLNDHYVDTGMGFERLVRILQNKKSNYDSDIFRPYIVNIENFADKTYGVDEKVDIAMRVIADHIRAVCVAICDGGIPSNVKEGYVIRRILRRAIRYGYSFLNFQEPILYELTQIVVSQYRSLKPEIEQKQFYIEEVVKREEDDFFRTISRGIFKLEEIIKNSLQPIIDGRIVFELYDTFGFPADLTDI
ncbi:MAG: alanine--tRNA ligase, partial [Clostridiales Family XIII bacterium]|nr:alanine--tRNA ligase [Clostridiales Family XIII bacterium]